MARSTHARLRVVLDTNLGRDYPDIKGMDVVVLAPIDQETELEE